MFGVTRRWQRGLAGSSRASAARTAPSVQSSRGRVTWRRRTALSWRRIRISAFLDAWVRSSRRSQLKTRIMMRYRRRIGTDRDLALTTVIQPSRRSRPNWSLGRYRPLPHQQAESRGAAAYFSAGSNRVAAQVNTGGRVWNPRAVPAAGRHPLALELAAAQLRVLSPQRFVVYADHLDDAVSTLIRQLPVLLDSVLTISVRGSRASSWLLHGFHRCAGPGPGSAVAW